jgi:hypothetical protein
MVGTLGDISGELAHPLWVLARRSRDDNLWLMPDFGFWSWNVDGVGAYESVATEVMDREQHERWEDKEKKLVWRGKLSYAPKLRRALAGAAEGKSWSAVSGRKEDYMSPADQCRYMFIAHAEGNLPGFPPLPRTYQYLHNFRAKLLRLFKVQAALPFRGHQS